LSPLYSVLTGTIASAATSVTLANAILELISLKYNSATTTPLYSVRMRNLSSANIFQQDNSFLASSGTNYFAKFSNNKIITFETASTNNSATYSAEVIAEPTDIDANTNPVLPDITRDAMAYFAFGQLLAKDQRSTEADTALKTFFNLSQSLVAL
jgi:hypothetical protein